MAWWPSAASPATDRPSLAISIRFLSSARMSSSSSTINTRTAPTDTSQLPSTGDCTGLSIGMAREPRLIGDDHGVGPVTGAGLHVDVLHVGADRLDRKAQVLRDLRVRKAARDEGQDLRLATRERLGELRSRGLSLCRRERTDERPCPLRSR